MSACCRRLLPRCVAIPGWYRIRAPDLRLLVELRGIEPLVTPAEIPLDLRRNVLRRAQSKTRDQGVCRRVVA